nr:zinc finger, CCHC-type [Tanacetum cinerariifolium]
MHRSDVQKNLYNALIESYNSNKDIFASYGDVVTLKRGSDDQDKDEEPSAGSNRGTKQRRSGKEGSSKEATQKESKSISSSKGASRSQPQSSGKTAQVEEHGPRVDDLEEPFHQELNTRNNDVSPFREGDFKRLRHQDIEDMLLLLVQERLTNLNLDERYNDNKGKCKHHDTRANPNKKPKVTCWKCEKPGHLKKDCTSLSLKNGNESIALVYGRGCVDLRLNIISNNIGSTFMSTSKLNDSIIWHARLGHVHFKRMQDMSKDGLILAINMDTKSTKQKPNLNYLRVWGCRATVRFHDPKLKTLGKRGIECIFVGYAEHSKAFRFYVIKPNDSVAINSIIESKDAIFDEQRFLSFPRPSQRSLVKGTEDSGGSVVFERVTVKIVQQSKHELRKSKRHKTLKDFRHEFQLYLNEGTRDEVSNQHSYYFNVDDDPKTFDEAMKKLKVDGTIEKFKARLVIQSFKQKSQINYFDTYAPVARISTIRLLIAMPSVHNLIIHQMDVKTTFLNRELEEDVYMNQPLGFIMPGNENKVCKLIKSLYGLKQAPKQWNQKFDEVVLSNGYLLNQAEKYVYSKFDASGKGVIFVYMFFMKDMGEADVILGIRIKHASNVSTRIDTYEKLMPNKGLTVSQLEYSRVIGCLMYAMTCTRHDIAFVVGKLSSNTEDNSSTSGWVFLLGGGAISWAFKKQLVSLVKPMEPISIHCDSAATLAKNYNQIYNEMSRHLCVRYSLIRELITNGVVSIKFVRSHQNLADHLAKGLARDLVIKSTEGMAEAHVLQTILRMCLEPAGKEDEVANFSMVNFFKKVLSRSMNREEPPIELADASRRGGNPSRWNSMTCNYFDHFLWKVAITLNDHDNYGHATTNS